MESHELIIIGIFLAAAAGILLRLLAAEREATVLRAQAEARARAEAERARRRAEEWVEAEPVSPASDLQSSNSPSQTRAR